MEGRIVFIDGHCVLCNGLAKYILKHNRDNTVLVASLQGDTAAKNLPLDKLKNVDTVLYLRNGVLYERSSAALHVISDIGGWRKLIKLFFIFPERLRNWVYNGVVKHRYKWFGKNDSCELPSDLTKSRILD